MKRLRFLLLLVLVVAAGVSAWSWAAKNLSYNTSAFAASYEIDNSARFNDDDSAYLNKTLGSGNPDAWTLSMWVKRGNLGITGTLWSADSASDDRIYFNSSDQLAIDIGGTARLVSMGVFRDPSAWMHLVVAFDAANAVNGKRLRVYLDGVEITAWSTDTRSAIATSQAKTSTAVAHNIGRRANGTTDFFDGYLSNIDFVGGQALATTSFGGYDSNNYWRAAEYSGSYGTNGFKLNFSNGSSLGTDSSANGNDWTVNNMDATDQVIDTPTNSFATLSPLIQSNAVTNGNLSATTLSTYSGANSHVGSIAVESGKYYCEVIFTAESATTLKRAGIRSILSASYGQGGGFVYESGGDITGGATGDTWTLDDVIGIALDADAGEVDFYKNGVSQGTATITASPPYTMFAFDSSAGQTSTFTINCGQGGQSGLTYDSASGGYFKYTPPTGFKALSTANLPEPDVVVPKNYFDAVTYTGFSSAATSSTSGAVSTTINIGSVGSDRAVVVYAASETEYSIPLASVTVDGKGCEIVGSVEITSSRSEMWYCDEGHLGTSTGSVTATITGTSALTASNWAVHAELLTGVDQDGPYATSTASVSSAASTADYGALNIPYMGIAVAGAVNGENATGVSSLTSPLVARSAANPSSAGSMIASGIHTRPSPALVHTVTWSGSVNRTTGVIAVWQKKNISTEFQSDFVWLKGRATTTSHGLFDSVRGVVRALAAEVNTAETTELDSLTGFASLGYVSTLTNPGGNNEFDGARGVFMSGNYAYIAAEARDSLSVIDVSDPSDPTFVAEVRDPGGNNELNGARDVFVSGNYAYVANDIRDSLAIIDVSNPASPSYVTEVVNPGGANELNGASTVHVSGNYAYVAADNRDSLVIINISNPASPSLSAEVRDPGGNNELDGASGVFVSGNYAYVANITRDSLVIVDVTTPASPSFVSEVRNPAGDNELDGAIDVFVQGNYAYVTTNVRDSLVVIDVSNPTRPTLAAELRPGGADGLLNAPFKLYVSGNYAYVAAGTRDSVAVIDISTPTSPKFVTEVRPSGENGVLNNVRDVFVSGDYAYVAAASSDLLMVMQATNWPGGFAVDADTDFNYPGENYVSWLWKEGTTSGFDIVTYEGSDVSDRDVSHSLGVTPDFALVKNRNTATSWYAWHSSFSGTTTFAVLDTGVATSTTNSPWGTGGWTSSTFRVTNDATNNTNGATWAEFSTELNISGIGNPSLTALTSTRVAFLDSNLDRLRIYEHNGSTWSEIGTQLTIGGASTPSLATLSSTRIALIDAVNDDLRVYDHDGSTWSLVGSELNISGAGNPAITGLTSSQIAYIDGGLEVLRVYSFDGSTWSEVGTELSIPGTGNPSLATLSPTRVAFIDNALDSLRIYEHNGSTWTELASTSVAASTPSLKALSSTTVALIDSGVTDLRMYQFNGSAWVRLGAALPIAGTGNPALAVLSPTRVAFLDSANEDLRIYDANVADYVAYLFAAKEGLSNFDTYIGNGSTDGPFVYTGFKPRYVMFKRTDDIANWRILDTARSPYNPTTNLLFPSVPDAETTTDSVDFLANGFKLRSTSANINGSGSQYVYAAFADVPFKYSSAPAAAAGAGLGLSNFLFGMDF